MRALVHPTKAALAVIAAAGLVAGCERPPQNAKAAAPTTMVWTAIGDSKVYEDRSGVERYLTRCWNLPDGRADCVWIGGTDEPDSYRASFTVERWIAPALPDEPGMPDHTLADQGYYSCGMHFDHVAGYRLTVVDEEITLGNSARLISQSYDVPAAYGGKAWAASEIAAWSDRTRIAVVNPLVSCERIGLLIQRGSWEALLTSQWEGPDRSAAASLGI